MQNIEVKFTVPKSTALAEGRAQYGAGTYQPSDVELQALDTDERLYLNTYPELTFTLARAEPTWPNLVDAIKGAYQAKLAKQAAEQADREVAIVEALAQPDDKWFREVTNYYRALPHYAVNANIPSFSSRYDWMQNDERVKARLAALQPELNRRQALANTTPSAIDFGGWQWGHVNAQKVRFQ